jgi:hypothetical protein
MSRLAHLIGKAEDYVRWAASMVVRHSGNSPSLDVRHAVAVAAFWHRSSSAVNWNLTVQAPWRARSPSVGPPMPHRTARTPLSHLILKRS